MEPNGSRKSLGTVLVKGFMKISMEKLTAEAQSTGFRAEILEKVARLTQKGQYLGGNGVGSMAHHGQV